MLAIGISSVALVAGNPGVSVGTGMSTREDKVRSWRVAKWSRVGAIAVAVLLTLFFTFVGIISNLPLLAGASAVLPAFFVWRCALHPRIELDDRTICVVNPFASHVLRLDEIVAIEPSYSGLEIRVADGGRTTAWAVQRSNFSLFLGQRSRSDRVADEIRAAVLGTDS